MKNEVTISRTDLVRTMSKACAAAGVAVPTNDNKSAFADLLIYGVISSAVAHRLYPENSTGDTVITVTKDELSKAFAESAQELMEKANKDDKPMVGVLFMLNSVLLNKELDKILFEEEEEQKHPEEALAEAVNKSAGESNDSQH